MSFHVCLLSRVEQIPFFNISITKIISFSFVFNYHNNQEQMLQKILE